jgi:hypothetical protein
MFSEGVEGGVEGEKKLHMGMQENEFSMTYYTP